MSIATERPKIEPASRYGVTQAAKLLGVHRNTIRIYCNSGLIQFTYRVGKRKVIQGKELLRLWGMVNHCGL